MTSEYHLVEQCMVYSFDDAVSCAEENRWLAVFPSLAQVQVIFLVNNGCVVRDKGKFWMILGFGI